MRMPPLAPAAFAIALLAGSLTPMPAHAQPAAIKEAAAAPGKLALSTERVIAFKDGYSLVMKRATGTADERGQVWTDQVPDAAVLGCFWATSNAGEALSMRAEWVEDKRLETKEQPCLSMVELLRANTGRRATLRLSGDAKDAREVSGTIAEVLETPPVEEVKDVTDPAAGRAAPGRTVRPLTPTGSVFVVLQQADAARLVLPIDQVREITGPDLKTRAIRREQITDRSKRLSFGAAAGGEPVSLNLYYFTPGVRWIPTYRLENIDSESPRLSLQGEILNEFEDLAGAKVDLVAGVPNFRFKGLISPLSLESTLRNALLAAAPDLMGRRNQMSNAMFAQRAGEWDANEAGSGAAPATNAPVLTSGGEQDLYIYTTGAMTLAKGGRATLPLWSEPIGLSHIYTLHIDANQEARPDPRQPQAVYGQPIPDEGFEGGPASPLKLVRHQVWHQLELANKGERPWTTGPALVLKEAMPIAQELLTYTPIGGTTRLPLTVAVDVRGGHKEEETDRKANALTWGGHSFGLITKRGSATVTNHRTEPSRMCITMSIPGKALEASDAGSIQLDDYRQNEWQNGWGYRINNHSEVIWEFELKPGESKTVVCAYSFYVP